MQDAVQPRAGPEKPPTSTPYWVGRMCFLWWPSPSSCPPGAVASHHEPVGDLC
ncbi:hypothetical protein B0T26DRAFT_238780 [Lasiosphaeria miniovina]|uniref:Uncharacterized protein n=1 Tax=Lasiosphaeria miniovina TaxID=1954250 RepID=A0AA40AVN6_9PEZI|nr:uncharacterized protein B0T26DRAFT_238780 [Lasiosphaeria miniovina]KAK0722880.1 hypothetical protein B0T26DRAFT_238780 [Lasiosphaeria miniovina]